KVSRKKAAEIDSRTREKILAGRVAPTSAHDAPRHRAASSAERTRGTPLAPGRNEVLRLSDEVLRLSDEALRLRSSEGRRLHIPGVRGSGRADKWFRRSAQ